MGNLCAQANSVTLLCRYVQIACFMYGLSARRYLYWRY